MIINLVDRNVEMCYHWNLLFKECNDVFIHCDDFFSVKSDCIVSPANSFGFMDGGLDLCISLNLGWIIQEKIQNVIKEKYNGELLVGQAELIDTENDKIPFVICAPTMRVPCILDSNTVNIYLASKAIFSILKNNKKINSVSISGLGTGVGSVSYETCAKQMKKAYDDVWLNKYKFPITWCEAQENHQLLYSDNFRDIQF